jgi:hypothetical protein
MEEPGFVIKMTFFQFIMGASPQTPGVYRLMDQSMKSESIRPYRAVRPSYFGHPLGARVALQHGPILRKDKFKEHNENHFASVFLIKLVSYGYGKRDF